MLVNVLCRLSTESENGYTRDWSIKVRNPTPNTAVENSNFIEKKMRDKKYHKYSYS